MKERENSVKKIEFIEMTKNSRKKIVEEVRKYKEKTDLMGQ